MEQNEELQKNDERLTFDEQLTQYIANESFNMADVFARAAQSYPKNKRKQHTRMAIAVVIGFIVGVLAMHFLFLPEHRIRL